MFNLITLAIVLVAGVVLFMALYTSLVVVAFLAFEIMASYKRNQSKRRALK